MKIDAVRRLALSLPDTTEEPHHQFSSFRVSGKIFMTVPPDEEHIHVFVAEEDREVAMALASAFIEKLLWGGKVVGVRINLRGATPNVVEALVRQAYDHKLNSSPRRSGRRTTAAKEAKPGAA